MKKTIIFLALLGLFLTSCQWWAGEKDEGLIVDEPTVDEPDASGLTTIEFYDRVDLDGAELIAAHRDYYEENMPSYYDSLEDYIAMNEEYVQFWKAGTFTSGDYEGRELVVAKPACDGPCAPSYYRFAADLESDEWTLLEPYSDGIYESLVLYPYSDTDTNIYITEYEAPQTIDLYENDVAFLYDKIEGPKGDSGQEITAATDGGSFVGYFESGGCAYGVYPDGLTARYMVVPKPFGDVSKDEEDLMSLQTELTYTALDGSTKTETYAVGAGKCGFGFSCIGSVEASKEEQEVLEIVGYFDDTQLWGLTEIGEESYETYSLETKVYEAYASYKSKAGYYDDETVDIMSVEEFLLANNVFFIKMDEGGYAAVYKSDYAPMGECGKPVIYLYPEEETVANVQVGIDEFTITDPVYGEDGWNVIAQPDGTLTNLADGLTYPYLFWEGTSDKNFPLGPGFTLSKKAVAKTLPNVLQDLGLNAGETSDFMEFWLPKLLTENGKYIEFNFVPQNLFDQVAPLTITPTPDQVIRIFMVYRGANKPGLAVPDFNTPKRYGFTVVEWGGDLH